MLKLYLLGQPQVTLNDQPISGFISDKVIALLGYIALEQHTHARETLAGLFWGEFEQGRAKSNLRQALHNLQKLLPDYLEVTRKTVTFRADQPHWIDVVAFEKKMVDALEQGAELYRGDLLQGVVVSGAPDFEVWWSGKQEQYRLLLVRGLEVLSEHYWKQGAWGSAENALQRIIELEPWRENAQRQLIELLARRGDYASALRQFAQCKQVLADELGIEPQPATQAIAQRIKTARQRPPPQLPTTETPLVGRHNELQLLTRLVQQKRLVTILGLGGSGKTRLALALAHQLQHFWLDGIVFLPLAGVTRADQIAALLANRIGAQGSDPLSAISEKWRESDALLILDNVEHLLPDSADFVLALLQNAPNITILATSRERLHLRAEQVFDLFGLQLGTDAEALVVQMAQMAQHGFVVSAENQPHITHIAQLVEGLPLALELAGVHLRDYTPAQVATIIANNLATLETTFRDTPDRHRSLKATFEYSWQLLNEREQAVLAKLSVFRGLFTTEAAIKVAGASLMTLMPLKRKSLVQQRGERWSLHEMIRVFSAEKLTNPHTIQDIHLAYYAKRLAPLQVTDTAPLTFTLPEVDNVRVAWQHAIDTENHAILLQLARPLHAYFARFHGYLALRQMLQAAYDVLAGVVEAQTEWGIFLTHYAVTFLRTGKPQDGYSAIRQSVTALEHSNNDANLAFALNVLGVAARAIGNYEEALQAFERCAALYRQLDHPELVKPLANLGALYADRGDYERGRIMLEEGLTLCRVQGNATGELAFLNNLGHNRYTANDIPTAHAIYQETVAQARQLNNEYVLMLALANLASTFAAQSDYVQSLSLCEESEALLERLGEWRNGADVFSIHANVLLGIGRTKEAATLLQRALRLIIEYKAWRRGMKVLLSVALWQIECGQNADDLLTIIAHHPFTENKDHQTALDLLPSPLSSDLAQQPIKHIFEQTLQVIRL